MAWHEYLDWLMVVAMIVGSGVLIGAYRALRRVDVPSNPQREKGAS